MSRPMLFGKYCLLERISVGGMAEVFRAKPFNTPTTDRFLALKRILPHLAEDDEFIKMFVDEAKLCVHLRHPNIVHIYELGRFQSSSYILMEYISGRDLLALQKRLRERRLIMSVAQACYVAMELAKGLDYAHRASDEYGRPLNIIHRDVSPQNVLISYTGAVKLIDFGVAKAAVQSTKTQVGVLKGKFGYMSPEQIRGESIDQRSDIFAVGTVLWELLTNRRLFTGDNEYEIFQKVRDADVELPSAKNPQVPPEVDRIVMKALSSDPNRRYTWAADLARELGTFLTSIQPCYTRQHLSDWMGRFFTDELAEERAKAEEFARIQTPEDVRRVYFGQGQAPPSTTTRPATPASSGPSPEPEEEPAQVHVGADAGDATQIWDVDQAPDEHEDPEAFASQHTVVQAGGFDLDEFMALRDDDILDISEAGGEEPDIAHSETLEMNALDPVIREQMAQQVARASASDGYTPPGGMSAGAIAEATRKRNVRAGIAAVAVGACLVLAVAIGVTVTGALWGGEEEPRAEDPAEPRGEVAVAAPKAAGIIVVSSEPAEGVEVFVDGVKRAEATPARVEQLAPGAHVVEVRHPTHEPFEVSVELREGGFVPVNAELDPR